LAEGIDVRGVEEGDATFDCVPNDGAAPFLVQHPTVTALGGVPEGHAAEAKSGDFEPGVAQSGILHLRLTLVPARPALLVQRYAIMRGARLRLRARSTC